MKHESRTICRTAGLPDSQSPDCRLSRASGVLHNIPAESGISIAGGRPGLRLSHKQSRVGFDSQVPQPIPHWSGSIGQLLMKDGLTVGGIQSAIDPGRASKSRPANFAPSGDPAASRAASQVLCMMPFPCLGHDGAFPFSRVRAPHAPPLAPDRPACAFQPLPRESQFSG